MADITLEQFEKEALAWLEANAERRPVEKAFVWGEGADNFYREKDRIRLQPANEAYAPQFYPDVRIQGKLIGVIRRVD